jgi:CheY-like chemotaxis protein
MEPTLASHLGSPVPWGYSTTDRLARPTILLIEDDRDIREMVELLLDMAGFEVRACDSAECALTMLRERRFDLILTDYALPRNSGLWLLQHAKAEGLIDGTPVMIVTAHPHVDGASDYEVIHKPFDLDDLVERVRYRVEEEAPRRHRSHAARGNRQARDNGGGSTGCPEPIELILYVGAKASRSFAEVRSIRDALRRFKSSRVKLTVCDLRPMNGVEHALTPPLARKTTGPRTFILGHVTNPELVLELLADCDADPLS